MKKSDQSYTLNKCIMCLENQPRTGIDKTEPTKTIDSNSFKAKSMI